MTLLSVDNLSIRYRRNGEAIDALNNVSFELGAGERLAVIGESGSGKSTLALALGGLLPEEAILSGRIDWPGFGAHPLNGKDIGFIFQDPGGSLDPVMRVGAQIVEVLRTHLGLNAAQARQRAIELLARVQLPDPSAIFDAYPHQLSGGQKQRIAIVCAIAAKPRVLVADEATSALDTIVQAEIARLILSLAEAEALSLVFITHDIALAARMGERIAVFHSGRLVEIGAASEIISSPSDPYTGKLLAAYVGIDALPWRSPRDSATAGAAE